MDGTNVGLPTKEEMIRLLKVASDEKLCHLETVGELLGMKLIDSLLPKSSLEPDWNYEGLRLFLMEHGIDSTDTILEALAKLQ